MFVNRDLDAPPLAEFLGDLPAVLESAGVDFSRLRFRERQDWEMNANWKAVVENYLECYHCPTAHPGFSKVIDVDPDAYRLTSDRWFSSQVGRVRQDAVDGNGSPPYRPAADGMQEAHFHYLWPTFTINVLPGSANLGAFAFRPIDADHTATYSDSFYGEDVSDEEVNDINTFLEQVGLEDQELVESIQRAARSGGLEEGQLLLSSEHLIQHFQRLVDDALR